MTSENIKGVRTIGGHVVGPFAVIAIESASRFLAGATRVIFKQVTGEDVMTRSLADLTNFSFSR